MRDLCPEATLVDPETIHEARRLLHDLVFNGKATTKGGHVIFPKDEVLVTMLEKIGSKKVEEPDVPFNVEGFVPKQTYQEVKRETRPDQVREGHPQAQG